MGLNGLEIALFIGALFSFLGFGLMGWDKRQASRNRWRVRERILYSLMFFGGAVGIKFGQIIFRHKTRKQPIATLITCALLWNIVVLVYVGYEAFFD